ncbi:MAG TPA: type IV secretory system conjugative DNA transfer family protein [Acidimicrobiales bacterium]|nr:type IV secretory system conjugative DNA transfer family protein [Acidimicrobiales bacterium]
MRRGRPAAAPASGAGDVTVALGLAELVVWTEGRHVLAVALAVAGVTIWLAWTGWVATRRRHRVGPRPAHRPASGSGHAPPRLGFGSGRRRRRSGRGPGRRWRPGFDPGGARWATRSQLTGLMVSGPEPGRLVLGRWGRGRVLLAAEARQSVLVVGPTQTLKTSGFAVPALLEWDGPVLAASVKTDLVRDTLAARRRAGRVWIYDPAGCTGLPADAWSPLAGAKTWAGARRTASALIEAARSGQPGSADSEFWYATSAKLLAPLLLAAAVSGRTMADVVRWVDTQETEEVLEVLAGFGHEPALVAATASFGREERARSSIFTTTETVLDPFAEPDRSATEAGAVIDPGPLLDGGAHSLFLCAPAHEQRRLRPLFTALVDQVVRTVYERSAATGGPLSRPLLIVLDEAAAIAPLEDLDGLAATGAGQGIQLVTVWQDLAQVTARYGARAASVINNHRAKILLSGVGDPATLEALSTLVGESSDRETSETVDADGARSTTETVAHRRLAPADALRRIAPGDGLLLYGHLPPVQMALRPWFEDRRLLARRAGSA